MPDLLSGRGASPVTADPVLLVANRSAVTHAPGLTARNRWESRRARALRCVRTEATHEISLSLHPRLVFSVPCRRLHQPRRPGIQRSLRPARDEMFEVHPARSRADL